MLQDVFRLEEFQLLGPAELINVNSERFRKMVVETVSCYSLLVGLIKIYALVFAYRVLEIYERQEDLHALNRFRIFFVENPHRDTICSLG